MVSICAPTFDLNGSLLLRANLAEPTGQTRRVTRTATLDGGVALADMGFAHGDRTIQVQAVVDREEAERTRYLQRSYPQLLLANDEGVFLGAINNLSFPNGRMRFDFLVKDKLTED